MKNKQENTINKSKPTYSFKPSLSGYKEKVLFGFILLGIVIFGAKYVLDNNIFSQNNPIVLAVGGFCAFIPFSYLSKIFIGVKSTSYTLSPERLTVKQGITSRTVSNLELWRVSDVQFHQTAIQLMFGEGYIKMITKDISHPVLHITGLTKSKGEKIYNIINEYVAYALQNGGVIQTIR